MGLSTSTISVLRADARRKVDRRSTESRRRKTRLLRTVEGLKQGEEPSAGIRRASLCQTYLRMQVRRIWQA